MILNRRKTTRKTTGGMRDAEIVTLTVVGTISDEDYDAFLTKRIEEHGETRTGADMPTTEVNGRIVYTSYLRIFSSNDGSCQGVYGGE